ncbi:thioredoxin [Serratia phage PS2]|uniref:Thioredoxin n=1 Tax=Serratia phage PS2 TaxID=1481112 RepID=A0A023W6G7_9CAUD|nr:thioredoxin [Serratia phage PS2]AHY25332.1 thioredoxin [Serratia phage PS2]
MITIYGFNPEHFTCAPCINAKRFCEMKKIPYEFISVSSGSSMGQVEFDEEVLKTLAARLGRPDTRGLSMPQIFEYNDDGDHYIGGFSDLRTYK